MTTLLSADDVRERLRKACEEAGGVRLWAERNGMTKSHVYSVLDGAPMGPKICTAMGLRRETLRKSVFVLDEKSDAA